MQAVIRTGGKQYYVTAGDILEVEKLAGNVGETITLDNVLMIANEDDVTVGQPIVDGAAVTARITGQYRGTKIMVFRYRPKKRIRVRRGHRQYLTRLEIQSIKFGDLEFVAPEPVVAAPVEPAPAPIVEDIVAEETTTEAAMTEDTVTEEVVAAETVAEATAETEEAEDNTTVDAEADGDVEAMSADSTDDIADAEETSDENKE
ncbi:MAG: 50S ribosomal protein L21 [Caldilineaceae bacterium]